MDVEYCAGTVVCIQLGEHKIDALLRPAADPRLHRQDMPVVLRLHGVLGNLLDETEHFLPKALAERGYASITMNTALANLGLFYGFGVFDDVIPQIEAVSDYLRAAGLTKVILAGHGLGAAMAVRYAAAKQDRASKPAIIAGLVVIAAPYSLPETIRRRWERFGAEPSYDEVLHRARQAIDGGRWAQDKTIVIRKGHGPSCRPEHSEIYTLKTWWALAGPEAIGARVYQHIGQVSVPLLLVSGREDEIVAAQEGEDLSGVARSAGNPDVTHVVLDANHRFDGKHKDLSDTVVQWLSERFGRQRHAQ
jgi:pimeloyl-ACP methyl ester carboxylesterase